jgi:signal transduction histidine kinase
VVGGPAAQQAFEEYARDRGLDRGLERLTADANLVHFVETQLAGVVGAASARIMVASVVNEEALSLDEVRAMLDEASQAIIYSHRLEQKSQELERATQELRAANERLTELDHLKDEFVATVSHELRTPLTSIRAFSQILYDNPGMAGEQRAQFLGIITKETDRLTRLINQVLDLARIEAGRAEWRVAGVDLRVLLADTLARMSQVFQERGSEPGRGRVRVALIEDGRFLRVDVHDNGPGVDQRDREVIFDKFRQAKHSPSGAQGSGLGLHICRRIVEHFGGRIWVTGPRGEGSCFSFTLPCADATLSRQAA